MSEDTTGAARLAELEADNRRLRTLLDHQNAPSELRHRLRNTVAMLRTIIRKSAETSRDLQGYAGLIEDRLDALARAQAAVADRGRIELHKMLADELFHYGASEGGRATLSGPDVDLQPTAGQTFALAIHELAANAVEHGALGGSDGRVDVSWSVAAGSDAPNLTLTWKEQDAAPVSEPSRRGFGTEVLTGMMHYDLKAATSMVFEPDGLRYTLSVPLPERVGSVSADDPA